MNTVTQIIILMASVSTLTFFISYFLVITKKWHGFMTTDEVKGVQKFHTLPTPRVGGIPIVFVFLLTSIMLSDEISFLWLSIGFASLPIVVAGLLEDIKKSGSINFRFFSAIISGFLFIIVTDYNIEKLGIIGLDFLLSFYFLSIIFTSLSICGIINSINIIDGFNGLASGTSIIILIGFSSLSFIIGDYPITIASIILVSILMGFFLLNFPYGKIFLGDGGAYFIGFSIACMAVCTYGRNDGLSPWACILICAYPITETIFSIIRKIKRPGHHPGYPDKLHLHMLIYRSFSRQISKNYFNSDLRNPITSLILWMFPLFNVVSCIFVYNNNILIFSMIIIHLILYIIVYRKVSLNYKKTI